MGSMRIVLPILQIHFAQADQSLATKLAFSSIHPSFQSKHEKASTILIQKSTGKPQTLNTLCKTNSQYFCKIIADLEAAGD